jgi:hypothetical protein
MLIEKGPDWWEGDNIYFHDKGPLAKGSKTRLYQVTTKTGQFLGHVKWMAWWRKYAFFTNNVILEEDCMSDLSQFIRERTDERRKNWKTKGEVDWDKVKEYDQNNAL